MAQKPTPSSKRITGIAEPSSKANPPDIDPTPESNPANPEAKILHPASDESAKETHEARNPAENRNAAAPVDAQGNHPETNDSRTEPHQYAPRTTEETQPDVEANSGMPRGSDKDATVVPPPGDGAKRNEELMERLKKEGAEARAVAFKGGEPKMGAE